MPRYMVQFSYTQQAWAALTRNPEDRTKVIADLAESMGGRMVSLDYCMGDYDGVVIAELPDDTAVAAVVMTVMNAGHLRVTKTTKLMSAQEMMESLKKAGGVSFAVPRG
ncbi:MAG TPA: GYD domain-containing protein [Thermomicrobiales bacterium]|nr:GYD domain-containing protein [Thermomicrobiales bacterium]